MFEMHLRLAGGSRGGRSAVHPLSLGGEGSNPRPLTGEGVMRGNQVRARPKARLAY